MLEEGLADGGIVVERCNVPWAASTGERVRALRRPDIAIRLVGRLWRCWWELRQRAREVGKVDAVLVGYLGTLDIHIARWCFRRTPLVLDDLAPLGGTLRDRGHRGFLGTIAGGLDRLARRRAAIVLVDTDEHAQLVGDERCLVLPVGAPSAWFDAKTSAPRQPGVLRIVFFGLFTPLQGAPTIAAAVARLLDAGADVEVTMVGTGQDYAECRTILGDRPEVSWLDWVPPEDLPALVASHDVCLGIFGTTPKARRVVPNKVFQGAAAGCVIVTSDTEAQRRALGTAPFYVPPGDPLSLTECLDALARDPEAVARRREESRAHARRHHRPDRVVQPLVARLGDVLSQG